MILKVRGKVLKVYLKYVHLQPEYRSLDIHWNFSET